LCGTDLELFFGDMSYYTSGLASYPIIPGHEWVGEVVLMGDSDVQSRKQQTCTPDSTFRGKEVIKVGDRVVGETAVPCWSCDTCDSGNYHRCPQRQETGIMNRSGAFANFISAPLRSLHKIDSSVPFTTACLVEPLSVALNALKISGVDGGQTRFLVVYGDGPIGLLVLLVAKAMGVRLVVVVGATPTRLEKAKELGADGVIDVTSLQDKSPVDAIMAFGEGRLGDVVIEATGNPAAVPHALHSVKVGGRLTLLGVFSGKQASLDLDKIVIGDITVRGTIGSPGVWRETIELIESGRVKPAPIVSHTFTLAEYPKALDAVHRRLPGVIKAVIVQDD